MQPTDVRESNAAREASLSPLGTISRSTSDEDSSGEEPVSPKSAYIQPTGVKISNMAKEASPSSSQL